MNRKIIVLSLVAIIAVACGKSDIAVPMTETGPVAKTTYPSSMTKSDPVKSHTGNTNNVVAVKAEDTGKNNTLAVSTGGDVLGDDVNSKLNVLGTNP